MAECGAALGEDSFTEAAKRAFAFVEERLVVRGTNGETRVLRHVRGDVSRGPGFLDDYSFLADAALDLYETTAEPRCVARARSLADAMLAHFWDDACGFYFAPDDGERLIHRAKDSFDNAIPSGVSIACKALLRLGALVDAKYTQYAARELERFAGAAVDNPF